MRALVLVMQVIMLIMRLGWHAIRRIAVRRLSVHGAFHPIRVPISLTTNNEFTGVMEREFDRVCTRNYKVTNHRDRRPMVIQPWISLKYEDDYSDSVNLTNVYLLTFFAESLTSPVAFYAEHPVLKADSSNSDEVLLQVLSSDEDSTVSPCTAPTPASDEQAKAPRLS